VLFKKSFVSVEFMKADKFDHKWNFESRAYLDRSTVTSVIHDVTCITGLTVLGSDLFVIRESGRDVHVYNINSFKLLDKFKIPGSRNPERIVACFHHSCLYISDCRLKIIYRYNFGLKKVLTDWVVGGDFEGLSVTRNYCVLVTLIVDNQILEYTPDGRLIRQIHLDNSIVRPNHCLQLSSDQFVVSHGDKWGTDQRRVCIVDTNGYVLESYGSSFGSDVGHMNTISCLTIDKQGHVFVADLDNNRVELLSPTLTHLGYIETPGHELNWPLALHLDELNHRLYIGVFGFEIGGHLILLDADIYDAKSGAQSCPTVETVSNDL